MRISLDFGHNYDNLLRFAGILRLKPDFTGIRRICTMKAVLRLRDGLSNEYFLAKFGADTEENEPYEVCSFG